MYIYIYMDVLPAHLNRDSFRDSLKGLVALEIIFDLPFESRVFIEN